MQALKTTNKTDKPPINNTPESNKNNYAVPVFVVQKTLTFEQVVALADTYSEPNLVEDCIIIGFVSEEVDVETAVEAFSNQTVIRIIKDELRLEKERLKPERKRKWTQKTTWDKIEKEVNKIFHSHVSEKELFKTILKLVRDFSKEYKPPYNRGKRGPKLRYDPEIVAALLIFKAALRIGNAKLVSKARELGIDARLSDRAQHNVPQDTRLRDIIRSSEFLDWLDEFISWLTLEKAQNYLRFFKERDFVYDGTDMKARALKETVYGGKEGVRHEKIPVKFLFNINLDMYVYAEVTTSHSIEKAAGKLVRGDVVIADPEFFTRRNCEFLLARGIKPVLKASKSAKRGAEIKLCKHVFDVKTYRMRKNGERGAKIYDEATMLYLDPERRRGMVKLMAASYNVKRLIKLWIKYNVFMMLVTFIS